MKWNCNSIAKKKYIICHKFFVYNEKYKQNVKSFWNIYYSKYQKVKRYNKGPLSATLIGPGSN